MAWFEGRSPVFGFGSNSVRQLRGRLSDPSLVGFPGRIRGQVLAFCGPNRSWAYDEKKSVGTATLIPKENSTALGTVAFLTAEQIELLDSYEAVPHVYQQRHFDAEVFRGAAWHRMPVMAYIRADSQDWYEPSQAYCCAILRNLGGSFPGITQLVIRNTAGEEKSQWSHPGFGRLELGAFLFEVGIRKERPWQMPREIGEIKQHFCARKVLCPSSITKEKMGDLMEDEDYAIVEALLQSSGSVSIEEDDSQAERVPYEQALM
ncbi:unnamed protein product [Durusdinium trenchii]|uniref:Gamma-glutamylcyclotransferase n=1 Tax=Durusdinium trenchii TaxID=1381693 RepID=A0ABP0NWK7_9DINO